MSLKAKIEAVVYAAEEPVTLAQLAALFAEETLEWKRDHQTPAEPSPENAAPAAEQVPLPAELDLATAPAAPEVADVDEKSPPNDEETASLHPPNNPPNEAPSPSEAAVASPEVEEKRLARQRDREVRDTLRQLLDQLIEEYAGSDRGIEIREIAGGYRIGTKPEYHDSVRTFIKSLKPPLKLSLQALETLAVIAYKQPVTAPEVSEIRGVDTSGVLGSLITRKLITTAGRKQVIGRPILYKTTREFLLRFGLKDVNELPSIEEFEKMAGELIDSELAEEPSTPATSFLGEDDEELPFADAAPTNGELLSVETPSESATPYEPDIQQNQPPDGVVTGPPGTANAPQTLDTVQKQAGSEQQSEAALPVTGPAKEED